MLQDLFRVATIINSEGPQNGPRIVHRVFEIFTAKLSTAEGVPPDPLH